MQNFIYTIHACLYHYRMSLYRVHFDKITHDRKRNTYTSEPSIAVVNLSDYSLPAQVEYAAAAFAKRPDLLGNVSSYRVFELKQRFTGGRFRLIAELFCSGNDHSGCRRFFR